MVDLLVTQVLSIQDKYGLFCNCKFVIPTKEEIHKKLPAGPSNLLLCRYKIFSLVSFEISEGSKPVRLFRCSCTPVREVLRPEICEGMVPVSLF